MVRRATLDPGVTPSGPAQALEAASSLPAPRPAAAWRGAGGRWVVWALRAVFWVALLVIGYRGVLAIVTGTGQPGSGHPASGASAAQATPASARSFPAGLAEAYALQFGQVYLNFSPGSAARRAAGLAAFLPAGSDPQLGWNGAGSMHLEFAQVASIAVSTAHRATVTLLARVNGRLIELGVPIYAGRGGMAVSGEPALLPPPARVSPPSPQGTVADSSAALALSPQLQAFFRAYASGDRTTLNRFVAAGASVTGLDGAVTFGSITGITAPASGVVRAITVSVKWLVPGSLAHGKAVAAAPAGLVMTYQMTIVRADSTWYVRSIGPAALQQAAP